jgi:hypothetical protein
MVFKLDHIFGNNGSLPSLGGTSLAAALAGVERAEAALAAARALARSAAKREGVAVRGLFEDSRFILRETGERWTDQARREGEKTMVNILSCTVDMDAADENSPFHHLAKRLQKIEDWPAHVARMRAAVAGDYAPDLSSQNKGEAILAAGRRARMSGDTERPLPPKGSLAAQIIAAGKRARRPTGSDDE